MYEIQKLTRTVLVVLLVLAFQVSGSPARAQEGSVLEGPPEAGDRKADIRNNILSEMAQIESDINEIRDFMGWQRQILEISRESRNEALRHRLPMNRCLQSVLVDLCPSLQSLFFADRETGGAADASPRPGIR